MSAPAIPVTEEKPPMKLSLSKDERHTLILSLGNFMMGKNKDEIDILFSTKEKMMETSQMLMAHAWKALIDAFPSLKEQSHLLANGEIRNECHRQLGEFSRCINHFPIHCRSSEQVKQMFEDVQHAYRNVKGTLGKRKAVDSPSSLAFAKPIIQAQRSFEGQAMDGAPPLFLLKRAQIHFNIDQPRLGEGSFAYVCECKVNDPNFLEPVYACKVIKLDEVGIPRDHAAAIEGSIIDIIHRGIISSIGICRDEVEPCLVSKLWNGGNLAAWLWMAKADGSTAPPKNLHSVARDPYEKVRFKMHIFNVINALLQTFEYLHSQNLLHNDFHTRNVFIHYSKKSDEVYAGIGDWGRATRVGTKKHSVPLQCDNQATRREAKMKWPWLAPECLLMHPKPYTKESDIYSLGFVIHKILEVIVYPSTDPKRAFVKHIELFCQRAMSEEASKRPKAYEFAMCMAAARTYGLNVVRSNGLRPFDE